MFVGGVVIHLVPSNPFEYNMVLYLAYLSLELVQHIIVYTILEVLNILEMYYNLSQKM